MTISKNFEGVGDALLRCGYQESHFNEFTPGAQERRILPVNQIVTKHTVHPPYFEISHMCSMISRLLIFKRLKTEYAPK